MKLLRKLVATAALAGLASAASAAYSGLYIFGDSLSDSGNNTLVIGSSPAQVITGNSYIPSFPYALGQYSNGDVWAKTFASAIGLAGFGNPSLAGGGDYAYGGARTSTDGTLFGFFPPSLMSQAGMYLTATGGVASSTALYVVAGGGNDARDLLSGLAGGTLTLGDLPAAATTYALNTGAIVDELQAAGAQHIIVWDVPNLGLAPAVTGLGPIASLYGSFAAVAMNSALQTRLSGEAGVTVFDTYGVLGAVVANPGAYGLVNITDACGAPSNNCDATTAFFWDGIHPTAAGHALLAQAMFAAAVPEPATYALLIGGLLLVGLRARRRV